MQTTSGITEFLNYKEGWARIKQEAEVAKSVGTIIPDTSYIGVYGMHIHPTKIKFRNRLKRSVTNNKLVDVRKDMARLRQVKQLPEINAIKKAVAITLQSLDELKLTFGSMTNEQQVDIFLSERFRTLGASGHAYDPIVASGINAATIHHQKNDGSLRKNELMLMDVGAKYLGYAADISRTWCFGVPTPLQQKAYEAIFASQQFAASLLKPGVIIREYQKQVVTFQTDLLIKAGVYKESERASQEKDYPHLISHHLGLDVHDAGLYDEPLVEGAVVTIEPGIYLPDQHLGIRIEDDFVITKTGAENLSTYPLEEQLFAV